MNNQSNTPKIIGAFVISGVLLIGAYFVLKDNMSTDEPSAAVVTMVEPSNTTTSNDTATSTEQPATEVATTNYADGTYSASKSYDVPEGHSEDISINITIADDAISELSVDTVATNDESVKYQQGFDEVIIGTVQGVAVDDAEASRLGGASLTSRAFNDLLEAVRLEARN